MPVSKSYHEAISVRRKVNPKAYNKALTMG